MGYQPISSLKTLDKWCQHLSSCKCERGLKLGFLPKATGLPCYLHHHSLIPCDSWMYHAPKQLSQSCCRGDTQVIKKSKHSFISFQLEFSHDLRLIPTVRMISAATAEEKLNHHSSFLVSSLEVYCINNTWCSLFWWGVSVSYDLVGWAQARAFLSTVTDASLSLRRDVSHLCLHLST